MQGDKQTTDRALENADRQVSKAKFDARLKGLESKLEANVNVAIQQLNKQINEVKKIATDNQATSNKPDNANSTAKKA